MPFGQTTLPDIADLATERRNRVMRAGALTLITLFVLGGLLNGYGVHASHLEAEGTGSLRVELTYPGRARPALAVPYELRISRAGGFDDPIEVSTTTKYLEMFDENGRNPEPKESTTDGDSTIWTFDPPPGDTLVVWLDTRVEPGVQWRRSATTRVRTGDHEVALHYTTWIFP